MSITLDSEFVSCDIYNEVFFLCRFAKEFCASLDPPRLELSIFIKQASSVANVAKVFVNFCEWSSATILAAFDVVFVETQEGPPIIIDAALVASTRYR